MARLSQRYPIPARLNLALVLAQVSCSIALLVVASRASWAWAGLAVVAFSFVMQMGFSLIHEAEHNKLHPRRWVNEGAGILLAALFPGSFNFMKVAHLAHHRRNRADVELVDYVRPGESRIIKSLQYYLLITGLIWLGVPLLSLLIALVPWSSRRKPERDEREGGAANYLRTVREAGPWRVRGELLFTTALWATLIGWLELSPSRVGIAYAAFAFSWASQQYIYHIRTPRHLIEGAFDLSLWRPLAWLYLHFNYHLSHHRAPGVPWLYMPTLAEAPPTRGYLQTYLALWKPPEPIERAFPREFQTRGPLPAQ